MAVEVTSVVVSMPVQKVEAVAVSANAASVGSTVGKSGAARIEAAMTSAIEYCYSKGITDPETVREKMMLARENVKRDLDAERDAPQEVTPPGN